MRQGGKVEALRRALVLVLPRRKLGPKVSKEATIMRTPQHVVARVISPLYLGRGALGLEVAACAFVAATLLAGAPAGKALDGSPPYSMAGPMSFPRNGPGLPSPTTVFGKEFSHDGDFSVLASDPTSSAGQVVAWDGLGGVAEG